jgi:hypothetical protein
MDFCVMRLSTGEMDQKTGGSLPLWRGLLLRL